MGARGALGQAVYDNLKDGREMYVVSADLAYASGFGRVIKEFPDAYLNVGIAEQNMIGIAAGLSRDGTPVIATSWAMFAAVRAADQIRNFMGYMQSNIKLIGMDSGFAQSRFGYSHANPPDIAIMRAIPGITIISPCDGTEIYKAVNAALDINGPVYIRLTGGQTLPIIYKEPDNTFETGKAVVLKDGSDVALISCGNAVANCLKAAELLEQNGVSTAVINMHTISPIDKNTLDSLQEYKVIATIDEHLLHGGLGSAVAEHYCGQQTRPLHIMIGVDDNYPLPGSTLYTESNQGLAPEQIASDVLANLRR